MVDIYGESSILDPVLQNISLFYSIYGKGEIAFDISWYNPFQMEECYFVLGF